MLILTIILFGLATLGIMAGVILASMTNGKLEADDIKAAAKAIAFLWVPFIVWIAIPVPSPGGWWLFASVVLVIFYTVIVLLSGVPIPEEPHFNWLDDLLWGKVVTDSKGDPVLNDEGEPRRKFKGKRPPVRRTRFWMCVVLFGILIVVPPALGLGSMAVDAIKGGSSAQELPPEDMACDGPELVKRSQPDPVKIDTSVGIERCQAGTWVPWTRNLPAANIAIAASAEQNGLTYFEITWGEGERAFVRTSVVSTEPSR